MANLERIYTIPLAGAFEYVRTKRARRAVKIVRAFALRHMKAEEAKVSEGVNAEIFRDGMQKPPRRLKVRIIKDEAGVAKVWLVGEQEKLAALAVKKKQDEEAKKKAQEAKKAASKKPEGKEADSAKPAGGKPAEAAKPAAKEQAKPAAEKPAAPPKQEAKK
ncbi:MAG: 50S ribosomal protein L31e [Candidatus Micrarchaeia archaeon]